MPSKTPVTAAVYLRSKRAVATSLSSREIAEHVPQALRENAVFSARTIYAEHVSETRRDIAEMLEGGRFNPAEIRTRMRLRLDRLGYEPDPDKRGGLQDLSSDRRTDLIIRMQEQTARGYAVWRSQQDEALMTVWPAQELYRAEARKAPRDWFARWNAARSSLGDATTATVPLNAAGPFVALKNDPVWTHPSVNRFGHPWTPFDYLSGMRLRQKKASEARALGVLKGREYPRPRRDPMRQVQSASAAGMDEDVVRAWADAFGGRARIFGNRVAVAPSPSVIAEVADAAAAGLPAEAVFGFVGEAARAAVSEALGAELAAQTVYRLDSGAVRHALASHGEEARAAQQALSRADFEALPRTLESPGRWRSSTDQEKGRFDGEAVTFIAESGERVAFRVSRDKTLPRLSVQTMHKVRK